jgi:hypothetical protein
MDLDVHLVKHMVDLMRDTGGMVEQINPAKLTVETIDDTLEAGGEKVSEKVPRKTVVVKKPRAKKKRK